MIYAALAILLPPVLVATLVDRDFRCGALRDLAFPRAKAVVRGDSIRFVRGISVVRSGFS